jgi:hypothetical protein
LVHINPLEPSNYIYFIKYNEIFLVKLAVFDRIHSQHSEY